MKIFISAVSREFKSCRDALASDLRAVDAEVKVQEDFTQGSRTLLEKLEKYVAECDRVIMLVGGLFGAEPRAAEVPANRPRRSYSQWEYSFANGERLNGSKASRKDLYVYFASRNFVSARRLAQDDADAKCQREFIRSLKGSGKDRGKFDSIDELRALVLRDGFRLPKNPRNRHRRISDWIADPPHPYDRKSKGYADAIHEAIDRLRKRSRVEAERKARQAIMNSMGSLTERFGATSSWLSLRKLDAASTGPWIDYGSPIELTFNHNTGFKKLERFAKERKQGIIGFVAATKQPYLTNDVRNGKDPHYIECVTETESELAAPILLTDDSGKERVIGVFNLESNKVGTFLEAHPGELMAAATRLAPEILILHHLHRDPQAFGWHPDVFGWTLEHLLDDFCAAVAGSCDDDSNEGDAKTPTFLPRPSCTVWYRDPTEDRLYVRGTARFDYEYVYTGGLSMDSFTGEVAKLNKGSVGFGQPEDLEAFKRKRKSKDMGMVYAFATPIFRPGEKESVGTVNLYFFQEELRPLVQKERPTLRTEDAILQSMVSTLRERFPFWLIEQLADELGKMIQGCQRLRIDVAAAHLRYRLHEQVLPGLTDFDTVKETILECLDADCCSIFGRESAAAALAQANRDLADRTAFGSQKLGILRCLATTGLKRVDGTPVEYSDAFYDLDDPRDQGVAAYLAKKPGQTLRRRSIIDRTAKGEKKGPPAPLNKYVETYSHADTEHRPFLGISVDDPLDDTKPPLGIIRVLRRSGSKPFVKTDETVLRRLSKDCHFFIKRWASSRRTHEQQRPVVCGARYPFLIRLVRKSLTMPKLEAMDRLGSEFTPGAIWNRRQVDAVMLDLINIFRNRDKKTNKQGALIANLRLTYPASDQKRYRIYAIHRVLSSDPPSEEDVEEHEGAEASIGHTSLKNECAITFDARACKLFRRILPESKDVTSGICMPLRFLSRNGVVWGVLSLDCDDMELLEWRSEHLQAVALAAKKLDFVGRDNCVQDDTLYQCENWRDALELFRNRTLARVGVNLSEFIAPDGQGLSPLLTRDWDALANISRNCRYDPIGNIRDVKHDNKGGFKMDLWLGAFKAPLRLLGRLDQSPAPNTLAVKMVEISHLWNRFACSRIGIGVKPLFKLSFREDAGMQNRKSDGLTYWEHSLELAPDLFGRARAQMRT